MQVSIEVATLFGTWLAHTAGMVWWAASLNTRVKHIESWMDENDSIRERLARLEQGMQDVRNGIQRLEARFPALAA